MSVAAQAITPSKSSNASRLGRHTLDLSQPDAHRGVRRVSPRPAGAWHPPGRHPEAQVEDSRFDIIVASARAASFARGGTNGAPSRQIAPHPQARRHHSGFSISSRRYPEIEQRMWERWSRYLIATRNVKPIADHVFAYVSAEDTPRPLFFQLDLLRALVFATSKSPQEHLLRRLGGVMHRVHSPGSIAPHTENRRASKNPKGFRNKAQGLRAASTLGQPPFKNLPVFWFSGVSAETRNHRPPAVCVIHIRRVNLLQVLLVQKDIT